MISKLSFRPFLIVLLLTACGGGGGDNLGPSVMKTDPVPQAKNVPPLAPIRATFAYPVDPVTVTKDTFFISGGSAVEGTISYENDTATFTPLNPWAEGTTYNAVLTTGVRDLDGIPLSSNFSWSFQTAGPDHTPPIVTATIPVEQAKNVSRNAPIIIILSEPMKPETINAKTFFISGGGTGQYEYDASTDTATLIPGTLAANTEYQVTVTTGVQDLAGNPLASNKTWKFSTGALTTQPPTSPPPTSPPPTTPPPNHTPPTPAAPSASPLVLQTFPCGEMEGVRRDLNEIWIRFKQPIPSSNLSGPFTLQKEDGSFVTGETEYKEGERRIFFKPDRLDFDTSYTATLNGIRSPSDNSTGLHRWRFKTESDPRKSGPDGAKPIIQCTDPPNGSIVPAPRELQVFFNEAIAPDSINVETFIVEPLVAFYRPNRGRGGSDDKPRDPIHFETNRDSAAFVLRDDIALRPGMTIKVTMTTGITDQAGNHLASEYIWSFKTAP
jgi:hypothetical protein